ncbi:hypothetical protein [Cyclobacterium plantarum]|uniref:hypothetical protein n=1 Tax=Cyclobacterium plantarum TaxID=2716263 RepID=UPI003F6F1A06
MKISSFRPINLLIILFYSATILVSSAQSTCDVLLREGLRNKIEKTHDYSKLQQEMNAFCKAYNENNQESFNANVKAKVPGYFKGGGSISDEEVRTLATLHCEQGASIDQIINNRRTYEEYIDPGLLSTYLKCRELEQNKELDIELDATKNMSHISLNMKDIGGDTYVKKIKSITANPSNIVNNAILFIAEDKDDYLNLEESLAIDIERIMFDNPQEINSEWVLSPEGFVNINFTDQTFRIHLPAIPYKKEIRVKKGLGEIVATILSIEKFLNTYSDDWMLADGSKAPSGSLYAQLIDENVPDLRGVFLRGKNYGRFDKVPEVSLGNFQNEATKMPNTQFSIPSSGSHSHTYRSADNGTLLDNPHSQPYANLNGVPRYGVVGDKSTSGGSHSHRIIGGDTETRPKNITVNYFIRVDVSDDPEELDRLRAGLTSEVSSNSE